MIVKTKIIIQQMNAIYMKILYNNTYFNFIYVNNLHYINENKFMKIAINGFGRIGKNIARHLIVIIIYLPMAVILNWLQ